ncbi:hypothetical protein [Psychrobacter sp. YGAH215]|uniref:hypothetical protein n=2 Tax=Psychrobacter TaxID=497 RepID=UPI00118536DC|nr:hypothetical protein [Psychrobacter sp. YGAH215]TSB23483.1 hypothetical protein FOR85_06205 [Psychrobacter sp. YGAH215]
MSRYLGVLLLLLIMPLSLAEASTKAASNKTNKVVLPKNLIVELIERRCSSPKPNPKVSPSLEYDCSDKYEDADGEEQSMDYSLRLLPLIKEDFNGDGLEDIALEIESMGPLGGSVYSNSAIYYLLLNKNKNIITEHEILLYAPFSEHIVDYEVKGKQIHYSAVPNFRSHPEAYEDGELLEPALEFTLNWEKGSPVSSVYRDNCRLSRIKDKSLLDLSLGGTSQKDIDIHDYTQVITESIQINGLNIQATLSGCDLSSVSYYVKPQEGKSLPVFSEVLKTLIPVAHHTKQLKTLQSLEKRSSLKFAEEISLYSGWQAIVHVDREDKTPHILIVIEQTE